MPRELMRCPFCGHDAEVKVCDGSGTVVADVGTETRWGRKMTHCFIWCKKCRNRTQSYLTRRGAFNAWNRRVNDEQAD